MAVTLARLLQGMRLSAILFGLASLAAGLSDSPNLADRLSVWGVGCVIGLMLTLGACMIVTAFPLKLDLDED